MQDLEAILRNTFKLESFREGQREIIENISKGNDTLVFMPTGGGKSLTYQLPGFAREGVAIVISPLISLMKDQVDKLTELGIRAKLVNSTVSSEEQRQIFGELREMGGDPVKFLYIAPERLGSQAFLQALEGVKISLVAIDEAHCVSQWWHDFRPSYMRIKDFLARLKTSSRFPTVALTATATEKVREDIVERLWLGKHDVFTKWFDRKNLVILVREISAKKEKLEKTLEIIQSVPGSGIVYCSSRKAVDEVYGFLLQKGISVGMYTGAMDHSDRENTQNGFMDGELKVIVATNAFGMGIDKKDIRFVIHYNLPGSIENYYQEIGRAGRDGKKSFAVVLASYGDTKIQEFFIENSHPGKNAVLAFYDMLYEGWNMGEWSGTPILKTQAAMAQDAWLESPMQASSILKIFERYGIVDKWFEGEAEEWFRGLGITLALGKMPHDKLPIDWEKQELFETEAYFKLDQIKKLLFFPSCRKRFILRYFGDTQDLETLGENCGVCDYCIEKSKFLSGTAGSTLVNISVFEIVLDTIEKYGGKFGSKLIGTFLLWANDAKLATRNMDEDENFGVLREYSPALVQAVIESLLHAGYLEKASGLYPVLSCSEKWKFSLKRESFLKSDEVELQAFAAMKAKGEVFKKGKKAQKKEKKGKSASAWNTLDTTLAMLLNDMWIKDIAQERDMWSVTIEWHIITLFENGKLPKERLMALVNPDHLTKVQKILQEDFPEWTDKLRPVKDRLEELGQNAVSYFEIKAAIAMSGTSASV